MTSEIHRRRQESHPMKDRIEENIRLVFKRADSDCVGYLTRHGLKVAMTGLFGFKPSKFEIQQLSLKYNLEQGEMTQDAFLAIMAPRLSQIDSDDMIRQQFVAMDVAGRGFITLQDLKSGFDRVGISPVTVNGGGGYSSGVNSRHVLAEESFVEADVDRDGKVGFREFRQVIRLQPF
ncbi:hypothetical protein BDR26DRAFT_50810 [Obelidium mucronatum]|nr:hypothetical protein BDR26DRAFT_50810 [Obelidium mucronatum]